MEWKQIEILRVHEFEAVNQMSSSMGEYGGIVKKAEYQYNGLGHRINQKIWKYEQIQPENPEHQIQYTLDLTRQYYNLLQKEDSYTETVTDKTPESGIQSFYWDRNTVSMEADRVQDFYLQDDLGSPVNLVNQDGQSIERYAYDEFGMPCVYRENKVSGLFVGSAQPFGFNGYQMDEAGGLYFAQARRYDAGAGRFISEDFIKGHIAVPYTMNHYSYCFNRPMDLVDLNGMWPKWVETTVKAVTVVTTVVAVGAVVVGTGGTAAPFIAGVLLAGTIGGFANENIGGSYSNGFLGGCFTGIIQGAGSMLGPIGNTIGGGIGSAVGTMVTEYLDNIDSTVEKNMKK